MAKFSDKVIFTGNDRHRWSMKKYQFSQYVANFKKHYKIQMYYRTQIETSLNIVITRAQYFFLKYSIHE